MISTQKFMRTIGISLLACMMLATGCKHAAPDTEVIGMMIPLTGNAARFGQSEHEGVQLAMDEINAAGGINGRKLALFIEDTKSDPSTAITSFQQLARQSNLPAIFGSAASLDVPAYIGQVDAAAVPHLVPVAVLPSITESGSQWTFRSALNDKIAAVKMADFVTSTLKAPHVGMLLEDSAFGETGQEFVKEATRLNAPPGTIEKFHRGDVDLRPQLTKLASKGVTHVQFWGYYSEYALAAKQIRALGLHMTLMGNQAPVNDKTLTLGGPAVEGVLNICLFVPDAQTPEAKTFTNGYKAHYGSEPDTWAAQSYDAMHLLASVMRSQGFDRHAIRDGLKQVKGFKGITGTLSFQPNGDAQFLETSIVTVKKGRWVPYTSSR